ncbi:hypothetical protein V1477_012452 [Vespula maculifrons]|uniref:Uncharacterized protein n=1 Tax=Vespula maculifrons TaxID=7453 RepID=A0ABD2BXH9_VESMC
MKKGEQKTGISSSSSNSSSLVIVVVAKADFSRNFHDRAVLNLYEAFRESNELVSSCWVPVKRGRGTPAATAATTPLLYNVGNKYISRNALGEPLPNMTYDGTLLAFLSRRLILQSHCIKPKGLHKTRRSMRPRSLQVARMKKEEEKERKREREEVIEKEEVSSSSNSSSGTSSNSVSGTIAGGFSSSRMRTDNRDESSVTDGTRSDTEDPGDYELPVPFENNSSEILEE